MNTERSLGLTCPVSEAIDPDAWLQRFAWPLLQSLGASRSRSVFESTDPAVKTQLLNAIRWQLRAALSEVELKLGVPMGLRVVRADPIDDGLRLGIDYDERIGRTPFYPQQCLKESYPLELPSGLISIDRVRLYSRQQKVFEFSAAMGNADAIRLNNQRTGSGNLVPNSTTFLLSSTAWAPYTSAWLSLGKAIADAWSIDYTLGPITATGEVGKMELVVVQWVYAAAGKMLFAQAGISRTQGLTNTSLSFDGFSKSIGLSAGANVGLYSALDKACDDMMTRIDWKSLRAVKRGGPRILGYGA